MADLGYRGFTEILVWLNQKLGISMASGSTSTLGIAEIIETRNVIAHNRSTIGAKYLKKVSGTSYKEGDLRTIDVDYLFKSIEALMAFVGSLDETVIKKFSLAYAPYKRGSPKPESDRDQSEQ